MPPFRYEDLSLIVGAPARLPALASGCCRTLRVVREIAGIVALALAPAPLGGDPALLLGIHAREAATALSLCHTSRRYRPVTSTKRILAGAQ